MFQNKLKYCRSKTFTCMYEMYYYIYSEWCTTTYLLRGLDGIIETETVSKADTYIEILLHIHNAGTNRYGWANEDQTWYAIIPGPVEQKDYTHYVSGHCWEEGMHKKESKSDRSSNHFSSFFCSCSLTSY